MPPSKTIWLPEEDALLWDSIPKGQRSEIIASALNNWKKKSRSPEYKSELVKKLEYLEDTSIALNKEFVKAEKEYWAIMQEIEMLREQIIRVGPPLVGAETTSSSEINSVIFFEGFFEQAQIYLSNGTIFTSPSGRNRYRIQSIDEEKQKVFVERMDSKSPKPSSFTYETVRKAVAKLHRDKTLEIGDFMPVLAQECAVVAIHPNLRREGNSIIYDEEVS
jgi:hypothetical protein